MATLRKTRPPILPRNKEDPAGSDDIERKAIRDFKARMRRIGTIYTDALSRIPAEPVVNAQKYTFRLSQQLLTKVLDDASFLVDQVLLQGGEESLWFFNAYVEVASTRGVAQQFGNLAQQSDVYRSGRGSVQEILRSPPYQQRMALLRAREFEEMKGLGGQVKADMSRLLTDGMARGQNPRTIAKTLTEQLKIEDYRAERIARTEINTALRRARLDEADDARETLALDTRELHVSALSPTTRKKHADRHGAVHTTDQQRAWWSEDGNSINCKCTTVSLLVNKKGEPLVPGIVERTLETKRIMQQRGLGPWTKE